MSLSVCRMITGELFIGELKEDKLVYPLMLIFRPNNREETEFNIRMIPTFGPLFDVSADVDGKFVMASMPAPDQLIKLYEARQQSLETMPTTRIHDLHIVEDAIMGG